MFIVCYKAHGALECEAVSYGPFTDYIDAEDFLVSLGALGWYTGDHSGYKFIQELERPIINVKLV